MHLVGHHHVILLLQARHEIRCGVAADCVTRALALARNCTPFLEAINANCGQLSIFTIKDILALAKTNISADIACYNGVAAFFNGVSPLCS